MVARASQNTARINISWLPEAAKGLYLTKEKITPVTVESLNALPKALCNERIINNFNAVQYLLDNQTITPENKTRIVADFKVILDFINTEEKEIIKAIFLDHIFQIKSHPKFRELFPDPLLHEKANTYFDKGKAVQKEVEKLKKEFTLPDNIPEAVYLKAHYVKIHEALEPQIKAKAPSTEISTRKPTKAETKAKASTIPIPPPPPSSPQLRSPATSDIELDDRGDRASRSVSTLLGDAAPQVVGENVTEDARDLLSPPPPPPPIVPLEDSEESRDDAGPQLAGPSDNRPILSERAPRGVIRALKKMTMGRAHGRRSVHQLSASVPQDPNAILNKQLLDHFEQLQVQVSEISSTKSTPAETRERLSYYLNLFETVLRPETVAERYDTTLSTLLDKKQKCNGQLETRKKSKWLKRMFSSKKEIEEKLAKIAAQLDILNRQNSLELFEKLKNADPVSKYTLVRKVLSQLSIELKALESSAKKGKATVPHTSSQIDSLLTELDRKIATEIDYFAHQGQMREQIKRYLGTKYSTRPTIKELFFKKQEPDFEAFLGDKNVAIRRDAQDHLYNFMNHIFSKDVKQARLARGELKTFLKLTDNLSQLEHDDNKNLQKKIKSYIMSIVPSDKKNLLTEILGILGIQEASDLYSFLLSQIELREKYNKLSDAIAELISTEKSFLKPIKALIEFYESKNVSSWQTSNEPWKRFFYQNELDLKRLVEKNQEFKRDLQYRFKAISSSGEDVLAATLQSLFQLLNILNNSMQDIMINACYPLVQSFLQFSKDIDKDKSPDFTSFEEDLKKELEFRIFRDHFYNKNLRTFLFDNGISEADLRPRGSQYELKDFKTKLKNKKIAEAWATYLKELRASSDSYQIPLNISAVLITPAQRSPRYVLLLNEIIKSTETFSLIGSEIQEFIDLLKKFKQTQAHRSMEVISLRETLYTEPIQDLKSFTALVDRLNGRLQELETIDKPLRAEAEAKASAENPSSPAA